MLGVETLKKQVAEIVIETEGAKELIREIWQQEHRKQIGAIIEKEIASMNDADEVTLYAYSGYGMHYSLESEKLSYRASRRISGRVEVMLNMFPHQPAPEKESDVAYKAFITISIPAWCD